MPQIGLTGRPDVRPIRGEGSSSFGPDFALFYARGHAWRQAHDAGFDDCAEIAKEVFYDAWVLWECTR